MAAFTIARKLFEVLSCAIFSILVFHQPLAMEATEPNLLRIDAVSVVPGSGDEIRYSIQKDSIGNFISFIIFFNGKKYANILEGEYLTGDSILKYKDVRLNKIDIYVEYDKEKKPHIAISFPIDEGNRNCKYGEQSFALIDVVKSEGLFLRERCM